MTRKFLALLALLMTPLAIAGEVGIGHDNNDPDTLPPETSEATTPATANLWQSLLDLFESEDR